MSPKQMNLKEFVKDGYLQEVNRQFFHPLGLALEINVLENGNYNLSRIQDYRDNDDTIIFADTSTTSERFKRKKEDIKLEQEKMAQRRLEKHGFVIQE